MLEFSDKPYDHVGPNPNRLVLRLAQQVNRNITLKSDQHRVKELEILNSEMVDELKSSGNKHILFVANHSTHSDPQVMVEVQRQLGMPSLFMAAYDVFLRSAFDSWVMRKTGAFSVDRDSGDTKAMKAAVETLVEGGYGLTIFPEGNVYFMNDRVNPFMEGAAYIALKAQKELGPGTSIWVVPVSIKATHLDDQRDAVKRLFRDLAAESGTTLPPTDDWSEMVKYLGMQLLRQRLGVLGFPTDHLNVDDVAGSLEASAELIIKKLEEDMEQRMKPKDSLTDRIRKLRRTIHQIRMDSERQTETPQADIWADYAMLALRILSYSDDYLASNPTLDRFAETCEKLSEDFTSKHNPPIGDRKMFVQLSQPIALSVYLEDYKKSLRSTLDELTRMFESNVLDGLNAINAENTCDGGELF